MVFPHLDMSFLVDVTLYNFLIVCLIKETTKIYQLKVELRDAKNRNEELVTQYDEIREIRHNFGNFIQALCGYVEVKNIKGIEEMCNRVKKETTREEDVEDIKIKRILNPAIEKLIFNKVVTAKQKRINVKVDIKTNLRNLKISTYDVCKTIGILLDNAIEAAGESKEKEIEIKIFENKKVRKKIICIENSYKGFVDAAKLYTKGYTSKTYEKGSHGIGLWSVKKIIESNDEIHMITKVKDKFYQQIEINF